MSDPLIAYITECRSHGFTDEQIKAELLESGHEAAAIAAAFQATGAAIPAPPAAEPATSSSPVTNGPSRKLWLLGGVAALLGIAIAGLAWYQGGSMLQRLLFWQSAPYSTDGELTLGMIRTLSELPGAPISARTTLAIELLPQTPGEVVPVWSELEGAGELMNQSGTGFLPSEGHLRVNVTSQVDVRDTENPLVDVTASADMLLEPFIAKIAGASRVVDGSLYARIDDVPAMFESTYRETIGAPLGTWLLVGSLEELKAGTNDGLVPLVPPLLLQQVDMATDQVAIIEQLEELLPAMSAFGMSNMAAVYTEGVTFFDDVDQARVFELLETYPVLTTTAPPERISTDAGSVFRYTVTVNGENMYNLMEALPSTVTDEERRAEVEASLTEVLSDLSDTSELDAMNKYFTTYLDVTPTGQVAGLLLAGKMTDHPESPSKIEVTLQVTINSMEPFTLAPPADVHPGSLFEKFAEQQRQQEAQIQVARSKSQLNNLRVRAELYYDDNRFSYAGVCAHFPTVMYVPVEQLECVDTATTYRVHVPLQESHYCVDSTGFTGDVTLAPTGPTCQ